MKSILSEDKMNEYIILYDERGRLDLKRASHAVESVTKMLCYKGQCMYLPFPGREPGKVILLIDAKDATDSETDWFLRRLGGYLGVSVLDPDGSSVFDGSNDNDISFLDVLPPPEAENFPIRLTATMEGSFDGRIGGEIMRFFDERDYDVMTESDGFSVLLGVNSFLDIFITPGENRITFDCDCTFSGAGIYKEAAELSRRFAVRTGLELTFRESDGITYTEDGDFDKLRRSFYRICAQQLAFAYFDDRDGYQAYFGWGTDSFEPESVPGSIATYLGRYEISSIIEEIEKYGLSYVCDTRFLVRNTPGDSAEYYVKEAMSIIWNSSFSAKDSDLSMIEYACADQCRLSLEAALEADPYISFPADCYAHACLISGHQPKDISLTSPYIHHYEVGYMNGAVFYGFGHYLRRFKLPGKYCRTPAHGGESILFFGSSEDGIRIECEVNYGYEGDPADSPLGNNFAKCAVSDIEIFDIGGSSLVRYADGGLTDGVYRAEAEVYIRDEVYRFAASCFDREDILAFRETIRECQSVEDWYDDYNFDDQPDPHANGATYCMNIVKPPCTAFRLPFPRQEGFFTDPHTVPYAVTDRALKEYEAELEGIAVPIDFGKIMEDFLKMNGYRTDGSENRDDEGEHGYSDEEKTSE